MQTIAKAPVSFTEGAIGEIRRLINEQAVDQSKYLRVGVKGGGCSGMTYILGFDDIKDNDIQKLKDLKDKRNKEQVARCLDVIKNKAINNENLMPAVIEAVENYCTLGEISDELRNVFGEYK